jgi:hypothetical protein
MYDDDIKLWLPKETKRTVEGSWESSHCKHALVDSASG